MTGVQSGLQLAPAGGLLTDGKHDLDWGALLWLAQRRGVTVYHRDTDAMLTPVRSMADVDRLAGLTGDSIDHRRYPPKEAHSDA